MRLSKQSLIPVLFLAVPVIASAATCTTQSELQPQDRSALAATGERLGMAILQQDYTTLRSAVFPAVASDWDGMHNEVDIGSALVKGGQLQIDSIYLLDASAQTAVADDQFFCSNSSGSLTVTVNMRALPPGKYAVMLMDAVGAQLGGHIGLVLVSDTTGATPAWKLGGISIRQGSVEGHDGVWYWTRARALASENQPWAAWYAYDMARYLLLPVDFISSPNMEKLNHEQTEIKGGPGEFPLSIADGARTWKIDGIRVDTSLHEADLGVTYDSLGIADPAAQRTEATAVLGALLRTHPELRQSFHGLWAYASKDGKTTPLIELPMGQIK